MRASTVGCRVLDRLWIGVVTDKRDTQHALMTAGEGINFRVVDVDTFSTNEIVGRCFCPATVMQQAMESNSPIVMSLGDGCAEIAFHSFRNHIERAQLHCDPPPL